MRPTDPVPEIAIRESMRTRAAGPELEAAGWMTLGVCPQPSSTWQTFRYHVGHGLVMGYPPLSILSFAWRNRRSFSG